MHLTQVGYEQQYQVVDASGAVLWQGGIIVGQVIRATATAVAIPSGTGVLIDSTSTFTRDDNPATSDPGLVALVCSTVVSAASVGFLGYTMEPFAASKAGRIASVGSLGAAKCTSGAIAVGSAVGGSGTSGLLASIAGTVSGTVLGNCIKAASQQGATGLYAVGILVVPR